MTKSGRGRGRGREAVTVILELEDPSAAGRLIKQAIADGGWLAH